MAVDRTAIDTITGYYYQFDYYILQLLSQDNPANIVTIEAIEDVDIHTQDKYTAVQCKYYEKTEYNHSVIAKPIRLMLKNFKENSTDRDRRNYMLYGHFSSGQSKLQQPISIDFLKSKFLSYTERQIKHAYHKELNLSDDELREFLHHLSIDVNACKIDDQKNEIIRKLKELFHCNEFEAECYYYNNALRFIRKCATEQDINNRAVSKTIFVEKVNQKQFLFDSWYLEYKGIKEYCSLVKKQYFSTLNISPYERFFVFECDQQITEQKIKSLIIKVSKNWSKLSRRESNPFCPYIYLHGLTDQAIINIKRALQDDDVFFIDGYDFKGSDFSPTSISRKATFHNKIKLKFVTQLEEINVILSGLSTTRVIYEFYINEPFYTCTEHQLFYIKIAATTNIEDMI